MEKPDVLGTWMGVTLYEHPVYGDEVPTMVKVGDSYYFTSYYDPMHDMGDMDEIKKQIDEIKRGVGSHEKYIP